MQVTDRYDNQVLRSLMVLRALTDQATGGIVAAPTTSLPEEFGGQRNWDYRYTWLRDASLTIDTLVAHDFTDGALHWRNWLLRAVAGDPDDIQIMYGIAGERELTESVLDHLQGYEQSRPVRVGNGAFEQYQADVVGEVMLALAACVMPVTGRMSSPGRCSATCSASWSATWNARATGSGKCAATRTSSPTAGP